VKIDLKERFWRNCCRSPRQNETKQLRRMEKKKRKGGWKTNRVRKR
jgi:hypothetical protein